MYRCQELAPNHTESFDLTQGNGRGLDPFSRELRDRKNDPCPALYHSLAVVSGMKKKRLRGGGPSPLPIINLYDSVLCFAVSSSESASERYIHTKRCGCHSNAARIKFEFALLSSTNRYIMAVDHQAMLHQCKKPYHMLQCCLHLHTMLVFSEARP